MDIGKVRQIVNSGYRDEFCKDAIIQVIAQDPEVMEILLKLLTEERRNKDNVLKDINVLLSKSHLALSKPNINEGNSIQKEIIEFYKRQEVINHAFANWEKII